MFLKPARALWGNLSELDLKKFFVLSLSLMFTIGPYWMLRGVREALFIDLVGINWQPLGKIVSFLFIIPIVLFYSKLVDFVKKEKLFFVVYPIYIAAFLAIAFFIAYPTHSIISFLYKIVPFLHKIPGNIVGWLSYVTIESFGALAPAMFWSFVASQVTTKSAKRGYGMIFAITQVGTILGSAFVAQYSETLGLSIVIMVATAFVAIVPFTIKSFLSIDKKEGKKSKPSQFFRTNKRKTGFFEGLRLLLMTPYLLGIFVITTAYEIIGTVLEFQMNVLAHKVYPTKEAFAAFYGQYGILTNSLTCLFALIGTSFFLRKFGLRICLLLFPIATGIIVFSVGLFPILPVILISMIILKGLNYSLNIPSKEILYIPTSRDIKFKTKGWIDAFGIRSVKASGAGINVFFSKLAPAQTLAFLTPIILVFTTLWLLVARFVSVKNHKLVKGKQIVK